MKASRGAATAWEVHVRPVLIGDRRMPAEYGCVGDATATTVLVHGSGRPGPRLRFVAAVLHGYGQNTLRLDLLSDAEAADRSAACDIDLLGGRLTAVLAWLQARPEAADRRPLGLFGSGTGAAAALHVAALHPQRVSAVVSCGGRPDLAGVDLARVQAPTLLVVGGADSGVLALNRAALPLLRCRKRLEVVPGATPGFEQPGALETVAHLAAQWLDRAGSRVL